MFKNCHAQGVPTKKNTELSYFSVYILHFKNKSKKKHGTFKSNFIPRGVSNSMLSKVNQVLRNSTGFPSVSMIISKFSKSR